MSKKMSRKKLKKMMKSLKKMLENLYYINRYYNEKIDDKSVLIESKNGEDVAGNMFYILKELSASEYQEYTVYLVAAENKIERFNNLLENYNISGVKVIKRLSLQYFKMLAKAKYLFTDTTFPYMFIKKDGQIYTNTWHGTPLKHMGNQVVNRKYAMGNVKRNFTFSDYLVYPNDEMKNKMMKAYGIENLYQGNILNAGYPRNAIFFNRDDEKELRKKLELENKQIICYMPTWRGNMLARKGNEQHKEIIDNIRYIDKKLNDNQIMYIKMHVLVQKDLNFDGFKHIKPFPKDIETYQFLNIADILITDYSSVFFDYANTKKKIILYTYDKEEYLSTRGFYYSLEEFPFPKVDTVEELVKEINLPKKYDETEFLKKFCTYDNKNAAKNLVKLVIKGEKCKEITIEKAKGNNKPNTLIYVSTLGLSGMTSSIISLMDVIDSNKENIYFSFRQSTLKREPLRIKKLPSECEVFPISSAFVYSFKDIITYILFYKLNISTNFVRKNMDKFYKREFLRLFGNVKFDRVIHFTGYEKRITGLLQRADAKRAIFVHNDMVQEIKTKGNQHLKTLYEAYNNYDRVVAVSNDIVPSIKNISKNDENIVIVNNAHDYKSILKKKEKEICFDENTASNVSEEVFKQIMEKKNFIKFINIARFSPEKGQKRLIDAFEKFYRNHKESFLIIIGGYGPLYKELNKYTKHLDSRYNIIIIKSISNPFPILKKCDLFILSSFYEALGLVLLEADTCGVPCISTDVTGPRGFMKKYNGHLVPDSEEGILQGMNDFVDGKIKCMNFDAEKYNQMVKEEYEKIFK